MAEEDDDYALPPSLACNHPPPRPTPVSGCRDDQVMELLWQNGQVVFQGNRSNKKLDHHHHHHHHTGDLIPAVVADGSPPLHLNHHDPSSLHQNNHIANNNLFIQEDEMATWLLSDFCSDLLLPSSSTSPTIPATSSVPSHPARPPSAVPPLRRLESFGHFSRLNRPRATTAIEATVVDSSDTPMVAGVSDDAAGRNVVRVGAESTSAGVRDAATCDLTVTSSSGASSASTEPIPPVESHKAAPPLPSPRKTTTEPPEGRTRIARGGGGGERRNNGEVSRLPS